MKLRISIFVDLVDIDSPDQATTQRISGQIIEHDYAGAECDKVKFIEAIKGHVDHVLDYVKTWLQ